MDLIEVDRNLFVTCRLCLEDLGQFQIVPFVRDQIKYCYDFDVKPFDGLPQLICSKCKEVLSNFFTVKKNLCEKQFELQKKIPNKGTDVVINIQPQQDTVSSSQQVAEVAENIEEKKNPKQKRKRIIGSTDSENSFNVISSKKKKKLKNIDGQDTTTVKWVATGFKKELVCTICNTKWPQFKSLVNHRRTHTKLKTVYPNVFNKKCSVTLQKIDNLNNFTGMNNIVVHNNNKIIENCNSLYYYVRYWQDKQDITRKSDLLSYESLDNLKFSKHTDPESTDTEQETISRPKKYRKRRILSRSSNETVLIEGDGNKIISDNEESKMDVKPIMTPVASISNDQCINIEDSSDSDTDRNEVESSYSSKPPLEAKLGDYKNIQGIITTCVIAYQRKRNESNEKVMNNSESQLKRKVLGIGRKIISKHNNFNGTGLLRYMEHKNLGIIWIAKGVINAKETNYIRIMTKLRGNDATDDNQGWDPLTVQDLLPDVVPTEKPDTTLSTTIQEPPPTENFLNQLQSTIDKAVLYYNNSPDAKNKLLNANPVANPKQLPRKLTPANELRINKVVAEPCLTFHNNEDTDLCMPIITSTTSLAVPNVGEQLHENIIPVVNNNPETTVPRIKVKPVTEMMSERMLNILRQSSPVSTSNFLQNQPDKSNLVMHPTDNTNTAVTQIENTNNIVLSPNVWVPQSIPSIFTSHIVPQITATTQAMLPNQPMQLVQLSCVNPINVAPTLTYQNITPTTVPTTSINDAKSTDEFVLLNSVELPNTKTNSPFKYLKNLSRIHNLILIDPHEILTRDFICLIKFKVQFKQEPIDDPVVLCLSLFCNQNRFCFTVRDRNQKDININKISPNWQWEIIKIFRGDLVSKLLENSQKHSTETYDYTKKFLCILKSINFQKLS